MRILVFGGTGMLGHKLVQQLGNDFEVWTTIREPIESVERFRLFRAETTLTGIDVTAEESVRNAIETARPDVVINAVGVVKQDPSAGDVVKTLAVNSIFPHQLAKLSAEIGFRLILVSTDCVFAGTKGNYRETDTADAYDLYGRSKNLGEAAGENVLILRSSIIGRELFATQSLLEWFLSNRNGRVKGFAGAIYSGFPTIVFADIIRLLITGPKHLRGLYHVSSDPINKYDLLQLIKSNFELNIEIERDEEFRIDRSLDSSSFRSATGFVPLPWEEMVERMAADRTPYDEWRR